MDTIVRFKYKDALFVMHDHALRRLPVLYTWAHWETRQGVRSMDVPLAAPASDVPEFDPSGAFVDHIPTGNFSTSH